LPSAIHGWQADDQPRIGCTSLQLWQWPFSRISVTLPTTSD
jgi:hypothetical protein